MCLGGIRFLRILGGTGHSRVGRRIHAIVQHPGGRSGRCLGTARETIGNRIHLRCGSAQGNQISWRERRLDAEGGRDAAAGRHRSNADRARRSDADCSTAGWRPSHAEFGAVISGRCRQCGPVGASRIPAGRRPFPAMLSSVDANQRSKKNSVLDEIVVTGTHIRGEAPVGSALIVYTRADIEQSGSATLDQFARNMTENFSSVDTISNHSSNIRFSPTRSSNGANAFQGASFNLHGLGPTTTLTLLNGQRLAPGGLDGSFTDISQIPLSAVDHIEVLPDGASAIYGADAVAGVVNIVTRRDFTGAETTVRYGGSTEGGADEVTASQLLGKSWSTGHVLLNYEFDDQNGLSASQRAYVPDLGGPYSLIPQNRRNSIFIGSSEELGAKTTLSGDVLYSDRHFSAANSFNSPPNSSTQSTVASGSAQQLNITAGLDVAMSRDWRVQVSGNYSRNQQTSDATTSGAPGSSPLNTASIEGAAPSIIDFSAITQGSMVTLPGGPLKAALGVSYRRETYESTQLQTSLGQTTPTGQPESRRQVFSVYGEIVAPRRFSILTRFRGSAGSTFPSRAAMTTTATLTPRSTQNSDCHGRSFPASL